MPARQVLLVTDQYYHVFNRGINKQLIFREKRDYNRALNLLQYYIFTKPPLRFSKFLQLSVFERNNYLQMLYITHKKLAEIVSYCLMPNHFHFLLRQTMDNGISIFLSNFQNSYTRYFNVKYSGIGPLLQGQFKAVRIEDDFQLFHVSRYIHLNPYSSFLVKTPIDTIDYPWSSLHEYIDKNSHSICTKEIILSNFKKLSYEKFALDQANYQKELNTIKHLLLEDP